MEITGKTKISRLAKRGNYDEVTIYSILDEALYCTVAYSMNNEPFQIPTAFCRIGDRLYIHGSAGSHFLRGITGGVPVCISVTLADGLVLARSAFHHSMNYRSVVMFSQGVLVEEDIEKLEVFKALTEKLAKGRWAEIRQPSHKELDKTWVLCFSIHEASAKIRSGPAIDDEEDMHLPVWAGVVPLKTVYGAPLADSNNVPLPSYLEGL